MEENNKSGIDLIDTHNYKAFREAYSQDALEYLYQLGQKDKDFMSMKIGDHIYVNTDKLVRIKPVLPEVPSPYVIFTLLGLIDYITNDPDELMKRFKRLVVHVSDPRRVCLYSAVYGPDGECRAHLATCTATNRPFDFNVYHGREDFMIKLMTLFEQSANVAALGKVVGNLVSEEAVRVTDDGMNQNVTITSGITRRSNVKIENPVKLSPIRTFTEINQPESPFILRIKNEANAAEPKVALYEADGDQWKVTAVRRIHDYIKKGLAAQIEKGEVVIIA